MPAPLRLRRHVQTVSRMAANGNKPKVVCIVGVAGFIGSHLLEKIIRVRLRPASRVAARSCANAAGESAARVAALRAPRCASSQERDWIVLGCDMVAPAKIQTLIGA